jgi:hypothetical protein
MRPTGTCSGRNCGASLRGVPWAAELRAPRSERGSWRAIPVARRRHRNAAWCGIWSFRWANIARSAAWRLYVWTGEVDIGLLRRLQVCAASPLPGLAHLGILLLRSVDIPIPQLA